jgi:hypothetical protein
MKKLLVALAAVLVTAATYGQGQVVFDNTVQASASGAGAPIWDVASTGVKGPGPGATAGLFLVSNGTATLLASTTFLSAAGGSYVNPITVDVPLAPGSAATYEVRVWDTSAGNYDAAVIANARNGTSGTFAGTVGGGTLPPTNLDNLTSFTLVPEPSTIALGVIGGLALLLRRRK